MSRNERNAVNSDRKSAPVPAYEPPKDRVSPLAVDRKVYDTIQTAERELVEKFTIDPRTAKAWKVPKGHVCRMTTPEGPQVGDLNIWNLHNPRERFWASRTRQLHATHVSTYDRLWSTLPYLRPMVTLIKDSLADYGQDVWGGRVHDLLGTRCDPYVDALLSGNQMDLHCHSNLTRAVLPWGLNEMDVHDVLNIFQVTGLNENGQYFMETSPARKDDQLEFFAEMDVLCALSACPGGDLSLWGWGDSSDDEMLKCCRPLGVEVYKLKDADNILADWSEPQFAPYNNRGTHGLAYKP